MTRGPQDHAALLNENGYVTAIIESFFPRRIDHCCERLRDAWLLDDAYPARPYAEARTISFFGEHFYGATNQIETLMQTDALQRPPNGGPPNHREAPRAGKLPMPRTITLPDQTYQPPKAERQKKYDMPGAPIRTVRRAFFRPVNVRREGGD